MFHATNDSKTNRCQSQFFNFGWLKFGSSTNKSLNISVLLTYKKTFSISAINATLCIRNFINTKKDQYNSSEYSIHTHMTRICLKRFINHSAKLYKFISKCQNLVCWITWNHRQKAHQIILFCPLEQITLIPIKLQKLLLRYRWLCNFIKEKLTWR